MKKFILLVSLFSTIGGLSQTLDKRLHKNTEDQLKPKDFTASNRGKLSSSEYYLCDDDGDGYTSIDIAYIESQIASDLVFDDDDLYAVIIGTSTGNLIKVDSFLETNPQQQILCNFSFGLTDVAIDPDKNYYICNGGGVYLVNTSTCTNTLVSSSVGFGFLNSLSFDKQGNLYQGYSNDSKVYRSDASDLSTPYVWHDFGIGGAGGDFVQIGNKIYISWINNGSVFELLEVTVDTNNNYISHIELGAIQPETYGLATELGKLYGITPTYLYQIDLQTFEFTTILTNQNISEGSWWGASGLHEAVNVEISSYASYEDAEDEQDPLPNTWTNTTADEQTIYIRIDYPDTNIPDIIEVVVVIDVKPTINTTNIFDFCENRSITFNILETNEKLVDNPSDYRISYHESINDAQNNINVLNPASGSLPLTEDLYLRVEKTRSECYDIFSLASLIPENVSITLDVPEFFTPNNDRNHDTWHIKDKEKYAYTIINIYDRFGRLIKTIDSNSEGWNGYYNNQILPCSDYWYVANTFCDSQVIQTKGHFTLKL